MAKRSRLEEPTFSHGPYRIAKYPDYEGGFRYTRHNNGNFVVMARQENDPDTKAIAEVIFQGTAKRGEAWKTEDPEGLANARLFAAAFDLHQALKMMVDHFGVLEDNEMLNETARKATKYAKAALRKVEVDE